MTLTTLALTSIESSAHQATLTNLSKTKYTNWSVTTTDGIQLDKLSTAVELLRIAPGHRYAAEGDETQLGHRHGHHELLLVENEADPPIAVK